MTHDENAAGLHDQLRQRRRHHARLDLGAALALLVAPAEEGEVVTVLDNRLIAAAGERHLDGQRRKIVVLLEVHAVLADADGHRRGNARRIRHRAHRFEKRELGLGHPGQISGLRKKQIAVALDLAKQTAVAVRPFVDLRVQLRVQAGDCRVGEVVRQFVVVVHKQNGHDGARTDIFIAHLQKLRQVEQVDHAQHYAGAGVLLRQDGSRDAVAAVAEAQLRAVLRLAAREPLHGKAGEDFCNARGDHGFPQVGQRGEGFVAPDQLVVVELDQRHRKGYLAGGALHELAGGLDIGSQRAPPPGAFPVAVAQNQQRHTGLHAGKRILPQRRRRNAEQRHHHKIQHHAWLHQTAYFLIQAAHSFRG